MDVLAAAQSVQENDAETAADRRKKEQQRVANSQLKGTGASIGEGGIEATDAALLQSLFAGTGKGSGDAAGSKSGATGTENDGELGATGSGSAALRGFDLIEARLRNAETREQQRLQLERDTASTIPTEGDDSAAAVQTKSRMGVDSAADVRVEPETSFLNEGIDEGAIESGHHVNEPVEVVGQGSPAGQSVKEGDAANGKVSSGDR